MAGEHDRIERLDAELRRVADSTDALVRTAQDLRAALDALADDVRELSRDVARSGEAAAEHSSQPTPAAATAAEQVEPLGTARDGDAAGERNGEIPEGARLVALDMVLDGRSRAEVAERLRADLELADPEPLLDEVYARLER